MTLMDAVLLLLLVASLVGLFLLWRRNQALVEEYSPIIDARSEVRRAKDEAARLRVTVKADTDRLRSSTKAEMEQLRTDTMSQLAEQKKAKDALSQEYATARALYDRLKSEIALLEENLEDISVGLYKPHYNYESAEDYKKALDLICGQQRSLVQSGRAAICAKEWEIQGDKKAGQRMTKQRYLKLVLRAFNGECDAATAKVSWSNVLKMEERIKKTYETLNDLGSTMAMRITPDYLDLRLAELRLEHE